MVRKQVARGETMKEPVDEVAWNGTKYSGIHILVQRKRFSGTIEYFIVSDDGCDKYFGESEPTIEDIDCYASQYRG
jgi:hypothetical protein